MLCQAPEGSSAKPLEIRVDSSVATAARGNRSSRILFSRDSPLESAEVSSRWNASESGKKSTATMGRPATSCSRRAASRSASRIPEVTVSDFSRTVRNGSAGLIGSVTCCSASTSACNVSITSSCSSRPLAAPTRWPVTSQSALFHRACWIAAPASVWPRTAAVSSSFCTRPSSLRSTHSIPGSFANSASIKAVKSVAAVMLSHKFSSVVKRPSATR